MNWELSEPLPSPAPPPISLEQVLAAMPGAHKTTISVSGKRNGRPRYPDVFVRVSDWEGDDKYADISQMRVGGIAQLGPDAHLVRGWMPGDDPLAVMNYEVVEETEPGVFRLEARPS